MLHSDYVDKYNESFKYPGLHCAMIFSYDDICECVQTRCVYSPSRLEVALWFEEQVKFLKKHSITFNGYIDGVFESGHGLLSEYIKV